MDKKYYELIIVNTGVEEWKRHILSVVKSNGMVMEVDYFNDGDMNIDNTEYSLTCK